MYIRKPTGADCSVHATCQIEYCFVKVSLTPIRKVQRRKETVMLQSDRGQLNVAAQSGFPLEAIESRMNQEINLSIETPTQSNYTDTDNQLVWSNTIHTKLNPQITRELTYSNTLLYMAQSAKTPQGVNQFWDSGATPPIEWKLWFSTLKMAIMARDSIEVDKLFRLKPQQTDLFYPTLPTNEEEFEGETDDEVRNREQRNERRRVDFENE